MAYRRIILETRDWRNRDDFYAALLPELGAPEWHGRNLDALWDSIFSNDINKLNPPFEIVLCGHAPLPEPLRDHLAKFVLLMMEARKEGLCVSVVAEQALGLGAL